MAEKRRPHTGIGRTVSGAILDGFLEVFWIFLKNEHGKLKFGVVEAKIRAGP